MLLEMRNIQVRTFSLWTEMVSPPRVTDLYFCLKKIFRYKCTISLVCSLCPESGPQPGLGQVTVLLARFCIALTCSSLLQHTQPPLETETGNEAKEPIRGEKSRRFLLSFSWKKQLLLLLKKHQNHLKPVSVINLWLFNRAEQLIANLLKLQYSLLKYYNCRQCNIF